jgi:GR25 family glycosyltransferase involved in LPS biosynthesis
MPPALVINLAHREDRLSQFLNNVKQHKITFAQNLTRIEAFHDEKDGNLGCLKSYQKALQYAYDKEWPEFIIFEDDATLDDTSQAKWNQMYKEIPNNADLLVASASYVDPSTVRVVAPHILHITQFTGSHFILYRRQAVERILAAVNQKLRDFQTSSDKENEKSRKLDLPYDHILTIVCPKKYVACPFVGYVMESDASNIRKKQDSVNDLTEYILPTEQMLERQYAQWRSTTTRSQYRVHVDKFVQSYNKRHWLLTPTQKPPEVSSYI